MSIKIMAFLFEGVWYYHAVIPGKGTVEKSGPDGFKAIVALINIVAVQESLTQFWEDVRKHYEEAQQMQIEIDLKNKAVLIQIGTFFSEMMRFSDWDEPIESIVRSTATLPR
jgi:hypothetical protein